MTSSCFDWFSRDDWIGYSAAQGSASLDAFPVPLAAGALKTTLRTKIACATSFCFPRLCLQVILH